MRCLWMTAIAALTALCLCGCDVLEVNQVDSDGFVKDGKPHFVLTINHMVKYPHAEKIEREVECFNGNKVWINTNSLLHSRDIEEVQMVPMPGNPQYYNLRLKLAHRGKLMWLQASIGFKHSKVALLVDGVCYRIFNAQEPDENSDWVTIEGPFHKYLASGIVHYAAANYKMFNPSNDDFFN
ncbi:MAG: hypothetical protein PHQ27_08405 [Victivallales bacterium]|nr:hypothetical protein [Victivallales bacterium]